jgi:hypothetical protein
MMRRSSSAATSRTTAMVSEELPNLGLLIKLMKLTSSSNDSEALLAVRKANEQLVKFGGDWEKLLLGKVTVIGDPFESVAAPKPTYGHTAAPPPPTPRTPPPSTRTPPQPTYQRYSRRPAKVRPSKLTLADIGL